AVGGCLVRRGRRRCWGFRRPRWRRGCANGRLTRASGADAGFILTGQQAQGVKLPGILVLILMPSLFSSARPTSTFSALVLGLRLVAVPAVAVVRTPLFASVP